MTLVVTRNVPDRYRGFLASVMLEVSPGTYVSPKMNRGVRERVWNVCLEWSSELTGDGGVTMVWNSPDAPGGLGLEIIGAAKAELVEHDGIWLDRHPVSAVRQEQLAKTVARSNVDPLIDK